MENDKQPLSISLEDALYIQNSTFFALCAALEKSGALDTCDVAGLLCKLAGSQAEDSARARLLMAIAGNLIKCASASACAAEPKAHKTRPTLVLVQGGIK